MNIIIQITIIHHIVNVAAVVAVVVVVVAVTQITTHIKIIAVILVIAIVIMITRGAIQNTDIVLIALIKDSINPPFFLFKQFLV